jgi:hypothetical protein
MNLLTQNSDLKRTGIYSWTLPAHVQKLASGEFFNTCPNAGVCAAFCYAKSGTYQFKNVKAAHMEKLMLALHNLELFKELMIEELKKKKYRNRFIRIHDAGDFFSKEYAEAWCEIAQAYPEVNFYSYTKEVSLMKQLKRAEKVPENFTLIYSYGGKEDHLIYPELDRHSDVFTDYTEMIERGYIDIEADDSLAATSSNHRIGLFRNNIKHFIKKQGDRSFRSWQDQVRERKSNQKESRS